MAMTLQSELNPIMFHKLLVQHNYHDHANDVPYFGIFDDNIGDPETIWSNGSYEPQAAGGGRTTFPMKLHELLVKTEEDGLADIISWKPHGRAFGIRNAKKFVEKVLPTYFGGTKFLSFQRQLNLYNFTRITEGPDVGAYYHEMFLRGKIFLADCITRTKVKGTRIKASANPEKEPNFYAMSYVGVDITALNAPVARHSFLEEKAVLSSIISHEQARLMDPSKYPNIERRETLTVMIPPFKDLEWMSLLKTNSLELDEIDTTGLCYSVHSFTGINANEFDTKGLSYSAKEGVLDCYTLTNDPPDELEWASLEELHLDLHDRNQFFCHQNSTEEEFGTQESAAKELKSITNWVHDFFDEPDDDLLHTRDIRMAPCPHVQDRNDRPDIDWLAMLNIGMQRAQSEGSEIVHSSSNLPSPVWGTGETCNGRLQPGQSTLSGVEKPSAPMDHEEYTNRLFTLVMRMEQSERSRLNADELLKTPPPPPPHSLNSSLQHSRSNLRQMIQDDCKGRLNAIVNQSNLTDPVSQNRRYLMKLRLQSLMRLLHASDTSDNPQMPSPVLN